MRRDYCRSIKGDEDIGDIIMVDQSPLARSPRSTPAVYIGVYDGMRELFRNPARGAGRRALAVFVLLQRRRRTLRALRRSRLRKSGDAVPQRSLPALPGVRRQRFPAACAAEFVSAANPSMTFWK